MSFFFSFFSVSLGQELESIALCTGEVQGEREGEREEMSEVADLLITHIGAYVETASEMVRTLRVEVEEGKQERRKLEEDMMGEKERREGNGEAKAMLSELERIETSSRVKGLLSRIQELENEHLIELERSLS